jgi:hypothetical protein
MKDDKKSILKEALTDYQEIMEAADANAKKKLAEEFPEKFNNLLKEEITKNKKSANESYKKLDTDEESNKDYTESKKESMKKQEKETSKVEETAGKDGVFTEKAKKVAKVEEDVKITDTVGKSNPFTDKAKKVQKVEEAIGNGKPFGGKTKKLPQNEGLEEFDVTELDEYAVDSAIENADDIDEVLTMEEIEREIGAMNGLEEELEGINSKSPSYMKSKDGVAYDQLVSMKKQLDEMINSYGGVKEMHQPGFGSQSQINRLHNDGPTDKLIDEYNMEEMHQPGFGSQSQINRLHNDGPTDKLIDEVGEEEITDADIEAVLNGDDNGSIGGGNVGGEETEEVVDEAHGLAYSSRRQMAGRSLPNNKTNLSKAEQDQAPEYTLRESNKKMTGLIQENKKLTKKLNETKKYKDTVGSLLENYKTALGKYRNQLKEMAVFNTNLAHVNNLLVNESLALTQDDKIKIINEFKKVDNITESQKKYKTFLSEMKGSKKTLTESVEERVTTSIQPSSKQKLDEVTAYKDDAHIQKMRKLIETIEKRGKRII